MEERKNIYFLSDFHLGVKGSTSSLEREKKVVSFLQSIEQDAKQVFLLGDILNIKELFLKDLSDFLDS